MTEAISNAYVDIAHYLNPQAQNESMQWAWIQQATMFDGDGYRNIFDALEGERIARAKEKYPAWFEDAAQWNEMP